MQKKKKCLLIVVTLKIHYISRFGRCVVMNNFNLIQKSLIIYESVKKKKLKRQEVLKRLLRGFFYKFRFSYK